MFAEKLGLGQTLGIDLLGEEKGVLPTSPWKKKVTHEQWFLGDTYHYGIGQGYLLVTPLQVNSWTAAIANGGTLYKPHLLKSQKLEVRGQKLLSEKTLSLIRQGMVESCSPGGVVWPLFEFKVQSFDFAQDKNSKFKNETREVKIACKTGTAETGGKDTLPHAWITLFAPAYDPQIVVTILSENSGEGSNIAAPIAKKILEAYFEKK